MALPNACEQTDSCLIEAVRQGDLNSLAVLFERHHRALFHFFVHVNGNRDLSRDLLEERHARKQTVPTSTSVAEIREAEALAPISSDLLGYALMTSLAPDRTRVAVVPKRGRTATTDRSS